MNEEITEKEMELKEKLMKVAEEYSTEVFIAACGDIIVEKYDKFKDHPGLKKFIIEVIEEVNESMEKTDLGVMNWEDLNK